MDKGQNTHTNYPLSSYSVSPPQILFRGYFTRHLSREPDSPPERGGLWIDSDALPSSFLVFLPKRFDKFLWNAKDGPDWRDRINVIVLVFFVVALTPVTVGTINNLLQAPPLGRSARIKVRHSWRFVLPAEVLEAGSFGRWGSRGVMGAILESRRQLEPILQILVRIFRYSR